jgi:MATE family multidrug resistance protein
MALLTDDRNVVQHAADYRWWSVIIPVAGMGAWDGVYIGLTATRQMLIALLSATIAFFGLYYGLSLLSPDGFFSDPNNILWISFIAYLFTRSAAQSLMAPRLLRQAF